MANISAVGVGVRHAVSRAIATANLALADATFHVRNARVSLDKRQRVVRAEATLVILPSQPIENWEPDRLVGVVNPDGEHPLMVLIPAPTPFFLDVFPVTWDRWLRRIDDPLPPNLDPLCPRTNVILGRAQAFAREIGKRLPTTNELRQAWGDARYPWGESPHPILGRVNQPRYNVLPEIGLHPATHHGLYDLGAWLWHWTSEGTISCGAEEGVPGHGVEPIESRTPVGFRLAQDL